MGLYTSDLARLGMLACAAWRACRLIIDTGLHQFGWTRDQALQLLRDNTVLARNQIEAEVDAISPHPTRRWRTCSGT